MGEDRCGGERSVGVFGGWRVNQTRGRQEGGFRLLAITGGCSRAAMPLLAIAELCRLKFRGGGNWYCRLPKYFLESIISMPVIVRNLGRRMYEGVRYSVRNDIRFDGELVCDDLKELRNDVRFICRA